MKKLCRFLIALALTLCVVLPMQAKAASAAPILVDATQTTVSLQYQAGYEYSKDGSTWQSSPDFTGLTANTTYTFYQRATGSSGPGQTLEVTTLQKGENPGKPIAPVIANATFFTVTLVEREGYEYRIDDGAWQDSPVFTNLYSSESHTFYQRMKETESWKPGATSEGLKGSSLGYGNSTAANFYFIREYVDLYGTTNSSGRKQVIFSLDDRIYYMELQGENICCWSDSYDSSGSTRMYTTTTILLKPYDTTVAADMVIDMYSGSIHMQYTPSGVFDRATFTQDTVIPLATAEAGSLVSNLYNASVKLVCSSVSYYTLLKTGLSFTDIGFFEFVDIDVDICDPAAGQHKGSAQVRYAYSATCVEDGYTGDRCCSFCGEVISAGQKTFAAGAHTYTDACDIDCNSCGRVRVAAHSWSQKLLADGSVHWTGCDICGEKRNVTACAGGQATCGTPATCATCAQPYGDVLPCEKTEQIVADKYIKDVATCQTVAVYYESCTACGKAGQKTFTHGQIDPDNHASGYTYQGTIPETCTQDGHQGERYCAGCGVHLGKGDPIPAAHSFTNYISNKDATYDEDGTETARCDRCTATDTRVDAGSRIIITGWAKVNGKWCYYTDGVKAISKWIKDSKGWCYLDANGYMVYSKWVKDSIGWCYVDGSGYMVYNKWVKDSKGWCHVGANGYMEYNKWIADSKGWCHVGASGYMEYNKWVKDSKGWCYVGASGYMVYNQWVKDSKGWCHVGANGYMEYNKWVKDSKGWCYVGSSGYMTVNGWVQSGGKWYYCNSSGYMATGWVKSGNDWYWMDSSGAMVTGWKQIGGNWYYFYNSGVMATNIIASGGYIGSNGVWDPNGTPYDRTYNTLLYSDSRVSIYLYQLTEKGVYFKVVNKTSVEITIQADTISLNRCSTDNITMSSDIAPNSTGYALARCSFTGIYNIGTISGQLKVISFDRAFTTYKAPFVNVTVDSSIAVSDPVINLPLVYSDEKVDIYYKESLSDGVIFTVRNKTDIVITLQGNSVTTNSYTTTGIVMSDDVSPYSVGDVKARCSTGATGSAVYYVAGDLRIIDFNYSFNSYSAKFSKYVN